MAELKKGRRYENAQARSDVVPRLFFSRGIGDIQRLQVGYVSECKVPNESAKGKGFI